MTDPRIIRAQTVFQVESQAISRLQDMVGQTFVQATECIVQCKGHVIVTGMGKAGKIAEKISATFASTGTPSIFLHPAEAVHGDLGRCLANDVVLALSNSGETEELLRLLPSVKQIGARLIAVTSKPQSALGKEADIVLNLGDIEEACPLGLAPTASTAAMLAMGDALAMVVLESRGFTKDNFALFHPAGMLGLKLLRVRDRMRCGDALPLVKSGTIVKEALRPMGAKGRAGAAFVVNTEGVLLGIFTDGDLRRVLLQNGGGVLDAAVDSVMIRNPKTLGPDALAAEARRVLYENQIDQLPIVDDRRKVVGLLDVQDLLGIPLT
ncbi:MAG: KpsF/GutQ family sugar-phosphate isomerase [Planctomycetes bacterium]|nr:KpsF/GutQ family sugar-phosphate isomerase [Planctomycetota bacterium]